MVVAGDADGGSGANPAARRQLAMATCGAKTENPKDYPTPLCRCGNLARKVGPRNLVLTPPSITFLVSDREKWMAVSCLGALVAPSNHSWVGVPSGAPLKGLVVVVEGFAAA